MNLEKLKEECKNCHKCNLSKTRNRMVFGNGNPNATIMLIGEGPGKQEDLSGEVFVGEAGHLLDKMLKAIDLKREDIYIGNIVKCRPPGNRDPFPEEQQACIEYLRNQVRIIKPKILVCLGIIAGTRIIHPNFKITAEHGTWVKRGDFWIIGTYHPAALLYDPSKKRDAWEDLKKIKEKLESLG